MFFRDLVTCNKDWDESTSLIIVSKDETEPVPVKVRPARSLFGDRQVLWFRDCVVMLL